MRNILMVCNTPFQLFVATWLKVTEFQDDLVDIVISNHMSDSEEVVENVIKSNVYGKVYHVFSKEMVYNHSQRGYWLRWICCLLRPNHILKQYMVIDKKYDILLSANLDGFTRVLYHTLVNGGERKIQNEKLKFYIYEEGTSTYSKLFEQHYFNCKPGKIGKFIFRGNGSIFGNVSGVYAFDTDCFLWKPCFPVIQMKKISKNENEFINKINIIFNYENMKDKYDKKYIYMEESFFADGYNIEDVQLLEKVATVVGKENIMVKIHPRNPINRFNQLGYKTNVDVSIPWEVIVLNQNINGKILLTIASASIINPVRLFDINVNAYSLYKCLNNTPKILKGELWEATEYFYKKFYPNIIIYDNSRRKV